MYEARSPKQKTVVSLTPLPLDRDSRTWKQAVSLAAAGYRSIAIGAGQAVEVIVGSTAPPMAATLLYAPSVTNRRFAGVRQGRWPWIAHAGLFAAWLGLYAARYGVRPLLRLPPADLVILHECSAYPAVRVRTLMDRVPFIYDAHDFYSRIEPPERQPLFDQRFLVPFTRALERRSVLGAAAVLTVSEGLAAELADTYGRAAVVIRNAHDERLDRVEGLEVRRRFSISSDAFVLVTIGNAKRGQALEEGLEALASLPPHVHWVCVGGGYERLHALAVERGLQDRLHLAGRLPPGEIVPAIREVDAALVLYHDYSDNYRLALPNGFFQAIAAGLPQILPPLPEISRLAGRYGFARFANPKDPEDIADAARQLLTDAPMRDSLKAAAVQASSELNWQAEETRFLDIVAQTLQRSASVRRRKNGHLAWSA